MIGIGLVGKSQIKLNIGADGGYFDLIENAKYEKSSAEQGKITSNNAHKDVTNWDYYGKTIVSDGIQYDVLINIRDNGKEQYVYDVTLEKAKEQDPSAAKPKLASGPKDPAGISISETEEKAIPDFNQEKHGQRAKIRTTKKM